MYTTTVKIDGHLGIEQGLSLAELFFHLQMFSLVFWYAIIRVLVWSHWPLADMLELYYSFCLPHLVVHGSDCSLLYQVVVESVKPYLQKKWKLYSHQSHGADDRGFMSMLEDIYLMFFMGVLIISSPCARFLPEFEFQLQPLSCISLTNVNVSKLNLQAISLYYVGYCTIYFHQGYQGKYLFFLF